MNSTTNPYRIDDAAQLAGTTAAVLRIWEVRYGWPSPERDPSNGYRSYSAHLVEQIRRVVALTRDGHEIGSLIVDGLPRWPKRDAKPARVWLRFATLQPPRSDEATRFRNRLEAAMRRRDTAATQSALHSAFLLLRPPDRMLGAWMPGVFGAREWELADRPLERDIPRLVRRLAGETAFEVIDDQWRTAVAGT